MRRVVWSAVVTALAMWILLYAPTPYLVCEPGIAVPVDPMITLEVDRRGSENTGKFLLTAVKLTEPNLLSVLKASVDGDRDIFLKSDVFGGYTKQQYAERLTVIMEGSQNDALEAAYRYLRLPFEVQTESIVVADARIIAGKRMGLFRAGDRLIGLKEGERFRSVEDAAQQVAEAAVKRQGNSFLVIEIERHRELIELKVELPKWIEAARPGDQYLADLLGVTGFTELRVIRSVDQDKQLAIAAGEIGGPSAGLVFALGAIDLLTEGDLTGGEQIAATGTIDAGGKVGAIGGIKQKVVVTSREGAALFIVPKQNEKEAQAKAKSMESKMKIVGVETLKEAMEAIASLSG